MLHRLPVTIKDVEKGSVGQGSHKNKSHNMQIAGNILLALAVLAAGGLFKMTFLQKMPGGDYGVGYAWATFFLLAAYWICMALVALVIGFGDGFAWLPLGRFAGGGMLALGFLILILGANLGMDPSFRGIRWLAPINAIATPLAMMVVAAVLLNDNLKTVVSPSLIKNVLTGVLALNSLMLASIFLAGFAAKAARYLPRFNRELDSFQMGILAKIDSCDASKDISSLFLYSGDNQPRQIREKAVLKIKSKPDWQDDLYRTLDSDGVDEAFRFLLANEVEDKPRFAKGVYQGLLNQARLIRERLHRCWHPSHVYNGQFFSEVDRSLCLVEKFKNQGVDFKPAVAEMRAALDEHIPFDNPDTTCRKMLDKWLKKH